MIKVTVDRENATPEERAPFARDQAMAMLAPISAALDGADIHVINNPGHGLMIYGRAACRYFLAHIAREEIPPAEETLTPDRTALIQRPDNA